MGKEDMQCLFKEKREGVSIISKQCFFPVLVLFIRRFIKDKQVFWGPSEEEWL